jgi:hypothetical protein
MIVFEPGSMGTDRPSIVVLVIGATEGACKVVAASFFQRDA